MRKNLMLLLGLASITILLGTIQGSIVINEAELNPTGDEKPIFLMCGRGLSFTIMTIKLLISANGM